MQLKDNNMLWFHWRPAFAIVERLYIPWDTIIYRDCKICWLVYAILDNIPAKAFCPASKNACRLSLWFCTDVSGFNTFCYWIWRFWNLIYEKRCPLQERGFYVTTFCLVRAIFAGVLQCSPWSCLGRPIALLCAVSSFEESKIDGFAILQWELSVHSWRNGSSANYNSVVKSLTSILWLSSGNVSARYLKRLFKNLSAIKGTEDLELRLYTHSIEAELFREQ